MSQAPPATPASLTREEPAEVNPLLAEARESFERCFAYGAR